MSRQGSDSQARELAQRILSLQRDGETDADFARRLRISPQLLHHYKKGGGASVDVVAKITTTEPRAYWLLTGEHLEDLAPAAEDDDPARKYYAESEMSRQIQTILTLPDLPGHLRWALIAEVRAAWGTMALHRAEVSSGARAYALVRAEDANERRSEILGRIEESASERLLALHPAEGSATPPAEATPGQIRQAGATHPKATRKAAKRPPHAAGE